MTGDYFLNRNREMSDITSSIEERVNVAILGERLVGKSSLLAEIARRNARSFIFVRVGACAVADENQFLDCFTREVIGSGDGRAWKAEPALWSLLSTRRMRAALSPRDNVVIAEKTGNVLHAPVAGDGDGADLDVPPKRGDAGIRMCARCGGPLKWIEAYKRHFCYRCKKYAPKPKKVPREGIEDWESSGFPDSCPECGSQMIYVHRYGEYRCDDCSRYPLVQRRIVSDPWTMDDVAAALDLPQRLSELAGKHVVVMLDDAEVLSQLGDGRMAEAMRLRFEEHEDVSYVFTGTACESMRRMFEGRGGAFYRFARTLELGRIADPVLQRFLIRRFRSGDGRLTEDAAVRITGVSEGIPGYAQHIGHELFHISERPEMSDVETAIRRVVGQQSRVYTLLWESIRSPLHRRYLFAVAREPGVPHGESFVRRYGLRSRSHVQRIESQLGARGIIRQGEILDPLFVAWLKLSEPL